MILSRPLVGDIIVEGRYTGHCSFIIYNPPIVRGKGSNGRPGSNIIRTEDIKHTGIVAIINS